MNKKSLLLTKAILALVAMMFCVNVSAQEYRAFSRTSTGPVNINRFTKEITLGLKTNSGKYEITGSTSVFVENGIGETKSISAITTTDYNTETGVSTLKVEFTSIFDSPFTEKEPGSYLLTFPQGSLAANGGAILNEKFSVLLNVTEDPAINWSIDQVGYLLADDGSFDYVITATSEGMPNPYLQVRGRTYTGSNNGPANYNARQEIITDADNAAYITDIVAGYTDYNKVYGTGVLVAPQAEAFTIKVPAGAYKTETGVPNPELTLTVNVVDLVNLKIQGAPGYNNFGSELPSELGEYYVQILNGTEPLNVKYMGNVWEYDAENNIIYEPASVYEAASVSGATITRIYPEVTVEDAAKGIFKLTFVKNDGGKMVATRIAIDSNSDYLVTFPKKTIADADVTLANANNLSTPITLGVDTDFEFFDTSAKVTTVEELHNLTYNNLTYNRSVPNAYAQPLVTPFDIKAADVKDDFSIARLTAVTEDDETGTTFHFTTLKETETAHALMPYLLKSKGEKEISVTLPNTTVVKPSSSYVYDASYADWYNSNLDGAVSAGDPIPGQFVKVTAADAAAFNILLPGAVQYSEVGITIYPASKGGTNAPFADTDEIDAYNATLDGAKIAGVTDTDVPAKYDAAGAAAYNATLEGARAAGYEEANAEYPSVDSRTIYDSYYFMIHTSKTPINPAYSSLDAIKALNKTAQFIPVSATAVLPAWRWYMGVYDRGYRPNYSKIRVVIDGEEDATAIEAVKEMMNDDAIYNVSGQRVDAPVKGVNIINGKKVLVK